MNPDTKHPVTGQTVPQYLAALSDFLPLAFVYARAPFLVELFNQGATVGEASTYARAFLMAPRVECEGLTPDEVKPFAALRAESEVMQMERALRAREDREL